MKTTEEIQMEERFSKELPFKVPENYFENFTEQMMRQLPERKPRSSAGYSVRWAAACLIACVIGIGAYLYFNKTVPMGQLAGTQSAVYAAQEGDLLDQAADYMMFDEHDFYAYLSEE